MEHSGPITCSEEAQWAMVQIPSSCNTMKRKKSKVEQPCLLSEVKRDYDSSIVYDGRGRSLVAGTREGRLMFWKNMVTPLSAP